MERDPETAEEGLPRPLPAPARNRKKKRKKKTAAAASESHAETETQLEPDKTEKIAPAANSMRQAARQIKHDDATISREARLAKIRRKTPNRAQHA